MAEFAFSMTIVIFQTGICSYFWAPGYDWKISVNFFEEKIQLCYSQQYLTYWKYVAKILIAMSEDASLIKGRCAQYLVLTGLSFISVLRLYRFFKFQSNRSISKIYRNLFRVYSTERYNSKCDIYFIFIEISEKLLVSPRNKFCRNN